MSNKALSLKEIDHKLREVITVQDYSKKPTIEGVQFIELKNFGGEDGYFMELARLNKNGYLLSLPDFKVEQLGVSLVEPGGIKAWHLHLNQEDIWFIPPECTALVGLQDLRESSPTKGISMRFTLGNHKSQLLLIPRGIAHGVANISTKPITMFYLVNQQFDINDPDERRLPWDYFGRDFWEAKKG